MLAVCEGFGNMLDVWLPRSNPGAAASVLAGLVAAPSCEDIMAEYVTLPLWTDAYLADTTHLTTIEHGAYFLLLLAAWRNQKNGCALPDDDKLLAKYARMTPKQWDRIKDTIRPFFNTENGKLYQSRLTDELSAVKRNSKRQSDRSKARWLKNNNTTDAVGMPEECRDDASLTLTLTHTPPIVPQGTVYSQSFERFWSVCHHKVGKGAAFTAWKKATKKATEAEIIEGLRRYIETKPADRPWVNPATFLNQERWLDHVPLSATNSTRESLIQTWVGRLVTERDNGVWRPFYGPKRGEPGCMIPKEAIEAFDKLNSEAPHD